MAVLLRHNVYQVIRRAILTCEFPPGQELREQILAEKYRVSRSPVRDSLLRLEQENLVTVLPRQGYRVNPVAAADIDDIFGLRMIIEPTCAAEAAKADYDAAQALNQFRGQASESAQDQILRSSNKNFHYAVAELAGNKRIAAVALSLVEEVDRLVLMSIKASHDYGTEQASQEHDGIIDAIQARDADTAYWLAREHIAGTRLRVVAAFRTQETSRVPDRSPEGSTTTPL